MKGKEKKKREKKSRTKDLDKNVSFISPYCKKRQPACAQMSTASTDVLYDESATNTKRKGEILPYEL